MKLNKDFLIEVKLLKKKRKTNIKRKTCLKRGNSSTFIVLIHIYLPTYIHISIQHKYIKVYFLMCYFFCLKKCFQVYRTLLIRRWDDLNSTSFRKMFIFIDPFEIQTASWIFNPSRTNLMKRTTNYKCKAWHSWGGLSCKARPLHLSPTPTRREARSPEWVKANFVMMPHVHVYTGNNVVTHQVHTSRDQSSSWPFILRPSSPRIRPLTMVSTIQLWWWMTRQKQDCRPTQRNSKLNPPTGSQGAGNLWPMRDGWSGEFTSYITSKNPIWFDFGVIIPFLLNHRLWIDLRKKHIIWWGLK